MATPNIRRVLVIGGSGLVGRLIGPALAERYLVRVLDPLPPPYAAEHVRGTSIEGPVLREALSGVDLLVYLAMGPKDEKVWERADLAPLQFDIGVTGLYSAVRAAGEAGVRHVVHASSLSVFARYPDRLAPVTTETPDATDFYGLAKRLGEQVLAAAVQRAGISAISLRLSQPMSDENWSAQTHPLGSIIATAGSDVAAAFLAALDRAGRGYAAYAISGDHDDTYADHGPARAALGWSPRVRHAQ